MSIYTDDNWTLGRGTFDDHPVIVRARASLPSETNRELFPHLILVSWAYEADENNGFPSEALSEEMESLETALFDIFDENSAVACGVAVITMDGTREWRFYASDTELFMEGLNDALAGQPDYPIELQAYLDPEWEGLSEWIETEEPLSGDPSVH